MKGQFSTPALVGMAEIDDVKAATTARAIVEGKRILGEDAI